MVLSKGSQAPDFTLFSHKTEPFHLATACNDKSVLLLFFPAAFTGVCTTELNAVNNDLESYGKNTVVVGISTDSPFCLAEFGKINGLTIDLLSDHDALVSAAYGTKYDHDFTGMNLDRISKRSAFVVDREGIIRYAEVLENAGEMPDLEAIVGVLASLNDE